MRSAAAFLIAAVAEIGGCYAVWAVLREGASPWWLAAAAAALGLFAVALAQVPVDAAGRAFAAYGGVYIVASLVWLGWVEGRPLRWTDWIGAALCIGGALTIIATRGPIGEEP